MPWWVSNCQLRAGLDPIGDSKAVYADLSDDYCKQLPVSRSRLWVVFTNLDDDSAQRMSKAWNSVEYQIGLLIKIPEEIYWKRFQKIGHLGWFYQEFEQMVSAYTAEDYRPLYLLIGRKLRWCGNFNELMLDNRNRNWIPFWWRRTWRKIKSFFAA